MNFEVVEGSRTLGAMDDESLTMLFLLDGCCSADGREFAAPLALPLPASVKLTDCHAVLLNASLLEMVVPDEISLQIVRETFFEFEVSEVHRRAAVQYLLFRLMMCEPPSASGLAERTRVWLQAHLDAPITLNLLCEQFGCSKSGLMAVFKRAGLRPPMKELAHLRIEKACDLLKRNELNISQIARATGYSGLAAFNHFFSRHIGRSPSDYRENCLWLI